MASTFRTRPIIAVVLGSVVTGAGHLYLRRWLRALGWVGVAYVVSELFVPESTAAAVVSIGTVDPLATLPLFVVGVASALDAYLLARSDEESTATASSARLDGDEAGTTTSCPACGKPVEPEFGFCHWCTTEFDVLTVRERSAVEDEESR